MSNRKDLELALKIKAMVEGAKSIDELANDVKDLGATAAKPIPDPTTNIRDGADKSSDAVDKLGKSIAGLVSIAAIKHFVDYSVDQFAQAESAFRGLESVANHAGVGIGRAMQEAEKLAADGSMTVAESSKALQNLLAAGFNVDQAVETLMHLKDAAAFNRQAQLSMGEAVVSASEGIKNENSVLVDNAGVTKNLSVIWKEYAESIGKSVNELTQQEKIQATFNGIARETEAQADNAAKAMDGFAGQMNKADAEMSKFGASMGQILAPAMIVLAKTGTWLIETVFKPIVFFLQSAYYEAGRDARILGILADALLSLDFSGIGKKIDAEFERTEKKLTQLAGNLNGVSFEPVGNSAKKAAKDTDSATSNMGKALKQQAKDRKDSVNEQIGDAERLRAALIKEFDDSLKAEKSYRDQAKKLRAEASQTPKDGSVEGQALATLDLLAAEEKLQRIKGSAPLEDVQAQSALVQKLVSGLEDQARAQEAVNRAKLAEADALDRAAAAEQVQQAAITEQQRQNEARLTQFQALLKDIEAGKTVKIDADTEQAQSDVEKFKYLIDGIKDKTITLKVNQEGGTVPGFASGGVLPGYGGGDRIPILAEAGEAIIRKEAVARYGRDFIAALNSGRIPRFAEGGIVNSLAASSPSGSGLHPVTIVMPGGSSYSMAAAPDVVGELKKAVALEALKYGRRK